MRTILFATALVAASPVFAAPTPKQLELETWRAFTAQRAAEFKFMFAPGFIGVYADGTHDLAHEMAAVKRIRIVDYKLREMKSRAIDRDNVLLTYEADVRHLEQGKTASTGLSIASLWHRYGSRWLCIYHTEIRMK